MMAQATRTARLLVLKKTKLGEADLILTCLSQDGAQVRCVAKGARKPSSSFSSRLELFSVADVHLASGRNLDIAREARSVDAHARLRESYDAVCAASPIVELLVRTTHLDLPVPRLFDMTCAALGHIERAEAPMQAMVAAAALLKAVAMLGYRPSFDVCVSCGMLKTDMPQASARMFSYRDGGLVCPSCAQSLERVRIDANTLDWAAALLQATFDELGSFEASEQTVQALLHFVQSWLRENMGVNLRSMGYVLAQC